MLKKSSTLGENILVKNLSTQGNSREENHKLLKNRHKNHQCKIKN